MTHTLKSGEFNLIGLTLHESVVVAGSFESVSGTTLTDTDVDFDGVLTDGTTYILEITNAANASLNGTIQEVTIWNGNAITTSDDLVADGLAAGDSYQLRRAATVQQVFGTPPALASTAAVNSSDIVLVPDGSGGYVRYFYRTPLFGTASWFNADTNQEVTEGIPVVFTDAIFVQLQDSSPDVDLVVTGSVKTDGVSIAVFNGFNPVSNVYPVGSTLQNSNLESTLTSSAAVTSSDSVWLPDGNGGYTRYFYRTPLFGDSSWVNATTGTEVTEDVPLTSAFFIQRIGDSINVDITPPSSYEGL